MKIKFGGPWLLLAALILTLCMMACSLTSEPEPGEATSTATATRAAPEKPPDPTPTPTPPPQAPAPTATLPEPGPCEGVAGEIEVKILVGPAEVVGLEPHAVGAIPFSVTTTAAPYLVQGGGDISCADILQEEWGTYEVTLNMQATVGGECVPGSSGGELQLALELSGSQLLVVESPDFHGEYPWEGTVPFDLVLPLEEGASMEGEGWAFVLHLNN